MKKRKIGLFNLNHSFLFHDLEEGFRLNGCEVITKSLQALQQPQIDVGQACEEVAKAREALKDCDYVLHVNWAPVYAQGEVFPLEKTGVVFFDPPVDFPPPNDVALVLQMTKTGCHRRIEWGVMQRFFDMPTSDIRYGAGAFMRLYLDQADALFRSSQGRAPAAFDFYTTAFERIMGIKMAEKIQTFQPFGLFGGGDWGKFGFKCKMNKHEDLHLWMAQCANIVDHCRERIGENPKYLYACAMDKPYYNIQANKETNEIEIVRLPWRKPRHIKEFCEEWLDLMDTETERRSRQFKSDDTKEITVVPDSCVDDS